MLYQEILAHASSLSRKQAEEALRTGENFNIFRILGLETREIGTHSAFLGELLNPAGSHGMRDAFLKLFLKRLDFTSFDTSHAWLAVEQHIGQIDADYMQGGRIDLYLEAAGQYLFIENKIYAGDQQNQLLRYHHHQPTAKLVYLTLDGSAPPVWSTGQELVADQYVMLSYRNDIRQWLEECQQVVNIHPVVRETIAQYLNLIVSLTGDASDNRMRKELSDLLQRDVDYFQAAADIAELFPVLRQELIQSLMRELEAAWVAAFPADMKLLPGYEIRFDFGMDSKTHVGLRAHKDGQPVLIDLLDQDKALQSLMTLVGRMQPQLKAQHWWLGWRNLVTNARTFEQMSPTELLTLQQHEDRRKQVFASIIEEARPVYQKFTQLQYNNE